MAAAARHMKDYQMGGGRSASYSYQNDPVSRGNSSEINRPGWRAVSAAQAGHHGVFVSSEGDSKSVSPIPFHRNDVVARHLLVETALLDSQDYELLPIEEVDALKKEKVQLDNRLEATRRKLALESKVRDAAQSLHRLYSTRERPTTPQSPQKKRMSFLGDKSRSTSASNSPRTANQAGDELSVSQKKIDDLLQILSGLESRRQYVEARLLRHTAAVLQVAHQEEAESRSNTLDIPSDLDDSERTYANGTFPGFGKGSIYEESIYSNENSDSMRDLGISHLNGNSLKVPKRGVVSFDQNTTAQNEKMGALQGRLETLNRQMRTLIKEARTGRDDRDADGLDDISTIRSNGEDLLTHLDDQAEMLDNNLAVLEQELANLKDKHENSLDDIRHEQDSIEQQLEGINNQIYIVLTASRSAASTHHIQPPPEVDGGNTQEQLNYLEESMLHLGDVLQQSGANEDAARGLDEAHAQVVEYEENLHHHESTLRSLWDSIGQDDEQYSLEGFSTRVQHLHEKSAHHETQMDVLRRQIQQQRELNSQSDGEKDRVLTDLQASHAEKDSELAELRARHVAVEEEATNARNEMDNVMSEMDRLKQAHQNNLEQKQQVLDELNEHRQRAQDHDTVVAEYEAQISEMQDEAKIIHAEVEANLAEHQAKFDSLTQDLAEAHTTRDGAHAQLQSKTEELGNLEAEVVRLTTELTMAKAELDSAYGSRAERAKDLTTAEIEALRKEKENHAQQMQEMADKHAALETELSGLKAAAAAAAAQENNANDDSGSGKDEARTALLEKELAEMSNEYQELTRETVEAEKEREKVETLLDGLRERCEVLEAQLSDEKVKWLGIRSPTVVNGDGGMNGGREMTSTAVLRNEFKKMMRETRAEGVRLLRVSLIVIWAESGGLQNANTVCRLSRKREGSSRPLLGR